MIQHIYYGENCSGNYRVLYVPMQFKAKLRLGRSKKARININMSPSVLENLTIAKVNGPDVLKRKMGVSGFCEINIGELPILKPPVEDEIVQQVGDFICYLAHAVRQGKEIDSDWWKRGEEPPF